jgi:hypothetical protein
MDDLENTELHFHINHVDLDSRMSYYGQTQNNLLVDHHRINIYVFRHRNKQVDDFLGKVNDSISYDAVENIQIVLS